MRTAPGMNLTLWFDPEASQALPCVRRGLAIASHSKVGGSPSRGELPLSFRRLWATLDVVSIIEFVLRPDRGHFPGKDRRVANVIAMQSRRSFLMSAIGSAAALMFADVSAGAAEYKAGLTTSQMRASGTSAKLTIQPLRNNVSVVSGSGGNVLVLPGPDGKLVVDSGFATSENQMSAAFASISSQPLRLLINTHWHFDL